MNGKKTTISLYKIWKVWQYYEQINSDSFFNFFESRKVPKIEEYNGENENYLEYLDNELEIGQEFLEDIIPDALLYYFDLVDPGQNQENSKSTDNKKCSNQ